MPKVPEYVSIAETLKAEILTGRYDAGEPLPGTGAIAQRFGVNLKTAGRAVQQLVAAGLLVARPGLAAIPLPAPMRAARWPMTGRYARARAARGLVFGGDVGGDVRKETVARAWVDAPAAVAHLLRVDAGTRVFRRSSRTYVDDVPTEETAMYFPAAIIEVVPRLESDDQIFVVALIEGVGFVIARTSNEVRARLATQPERALFRLDRGGIVLEHTHGTYGADDVPLEAVINVRPAIGNVITFDTFEGPDQESKE